MCSFITWPRYRQHLDRSIGLQLSIGAQVWSEKRDALVAEADNTAHALQQYMTIAAKEVEGIDDDSIEMYAGCFFGSI
jgi:hypothetical protein